MANGVLEGLKFAEARRQARLAQQLAEKQLEVQKQQQEALLEQRKIEHKDRSEQEKAAFKAAEAVRELQRVQVKQDIVKGHVQGLPTPGVTVLDEKDGQQTLRLPWDSMQQIPGVIGEVPLPETVQAPTPDKFAKDQAARQEALEEPKRKTQASLQMAELVRQLEVQKQRDIAARQAQLEAERIGDERQAALLGTQERIAAGHDAARINAQRQDLRLDKSYNHEIAEIGKVEKPITERLARYGNLVDTVNQQTPQADALIAPELLTVMAGGSGSGLRMSEAELSRIIGGRTHLEGLKAALDKWSTDPSKGLSIRPEQRAQIKALLLEVGKKLQAKQDILTQGRLELIDAKDPIEQRKITTRVFSQIRDVDKPAVESLSTTSGKIKVRRKADGVLGEVSEKFFDPNKYEKVTK